MKNNPIPGAARKLIGVRIAPDIPMLGQGECMRTIITHAIMRIISKYTIRCVSSIERVYVVILYLQTINSYEISLSILCISSVFP